MNSKITNDHLGRGAVVYVRQSTMGQVVENTESQRRQYALAESAGALGFSSLTTIDDDLGRSGSGVVERPGFQRLVACVCSGAIGAVFCIEASRLARNGWDWDHTTLGLLDREYIPVVRNPLAIHCKRGTSKHSRRRTSGSLTGIQVEQYCGTSMQGVDSSQITWYL